jgi:hypothetical protein
MNIRPIRCLVRDTPSSGNRAVYSLKVLLEGIGLPCALVNDPKEADLAYSLTRPEGLPERALWMQPICVENWDSMEPEIFWKEGIPWVGSPCTLGDFDGDILYSVYALLTGSFETSESKDQWGVPIVRGGRYDKLGLLGTPSIALYCDLLFNILEKKIGPGIETIQRWPGNKRYAVVLSHDVDAPFSFIDTDYRRRRIAKLFRERAFPEVTKSMFSYVLTSVRKTLGYLPKPENDPNFSFDAWMELQRKLGAKSAFYVSTVSSSDMYGDIRDVTYLYNRTHIVQAIRKAIEQGWEIGLHGSMNAWREDDRISKEKADLERVLLGYKLKGVRHHYWALDDRLPERTLAVHAQAGFEYDSSLGLNDSPGFRRGMAWPFTPYNKSIGEEIPIIEIPPTIMDGGVFYREVTPELGRNEVIEHIKATFAVGGAVVMDWHLEQMNPVRLRQAGPILAEILCELVSDSEIYWASPAEMSDWWIRRRAHLAECLCQ